MSVCCLHIWYIHRVCVYGMYTLHRNICFLICIYFSVVQLFSKLYTAVIMEDLAMITILQFLLSVIADWYTLVLTGVILLFFFPVVILILFYAVAVFLYAYKSRRRARYKEGGCWTTHFWNSARLSVCTFLSLLAKYWHGKVLFTTLSNLIYFFI